MLFYNKFGFFCRELIDDLFINIYADIGNIFIILILYFFQLSLSKIIPHILEKMTKQQKYNIRHNIVGIGNY